MGCWVGGRQHAGKFSQTKVARRREGARDRGVSTAERFISLRDRQIIMRQERRRLFVFFFLGELGHTNRRQVHLRHELVKPVFRE